MNWKPFAFNNVRLMIPETWDLNRFSGNCVQGDMVLDDGKCATLDAQWGKCTSDKLTTVEEKLITRKKGIEVEKRFDLAESSTAYLVNGKEGRTGYILVLESKLNRFLLFRHFNPPGQLQSFARNLIRSLGEAKPEDAQTWRFFSTHFVLPTGFLLTGAEIKAGCSRLDFAKMGRELTLWDLSLLNQFEKKQNTAEVAVQLIQKEFIKRYSFLLNEKKEGKDKAEFLIPGQMKRRWLINPVKAVTGNRQALLQGIANRGANRFSILFYRCRNIEEMAWLGDMACSLRKTEDFQ